MSKTNIPQPNLSAAQIAQFWSKVDRSPGQGPKGDCWEWKGYQLPGQWNYGKVYFRSIVRTSFLAHRVAFFLSTNIWPTNDCVMHSCDNPPCCNPAHLSEGTFVDNGQDASHKGRSAFGDRNGARLYPGRMIRTEKLSADDVQTIRGLHVQGVSQSDIAAKYGIDPSNVSLIVRRLTWTHI